MNNRISTDLFGDNGEDVKRALPELYGREVQKRRSVLKSYIGSNTNRLLDTINKRAVQF